MSKVDNNTNMKLSEAVENDGNLQIQQVEIGKLLKDTEGLLVFDNVRTGLQKDFGNISYETLLYLSTDLFFQFIDSPKECEDIQGDFFLGEIKKQCRYEFYLKQALINKGKNSIPNDVIEQGGFLTKILNQTCKNNEEYACMLLPYNSNIITREDFLVYSKRYVSEKNMKYTQLPLDSLGYFLFQENLNVISSVEKIAHIYYDKALFYRAVYDNDKDICKDIFTESFKSYCNDFFNKSSEQEYKNLFTDFYKGLQK